MRHLTAPVLALVALFLLAASPASAVKRHDFKTCAQSGFCRRLRDLPPSSSASPYSIDSSTLQYNEQTGWLSAEVKTSLYPEITFALDIGVTEQGLARVKVDEKHGLRQRYNETGQWALVKEPSIATSTRFSLDKAGKVATLSWNTASSLHSASITLSPLKLEFMRDGEVQVSFNEQNLFHMEHFRVKKVGTDQQDPPEVVIDDKTKKAREAFDPFMSEDGAWEEDFGGRKDTKPKGPESLSFDVTFPGYQHVFGIPQHASPLSLRTTRGGEGAFTDPYRLFNLDTFEYLADSEMGIYGSIPFMHAHKSNSTVAIFSLTGSETWVDITKTSKSTQTHWMSETGILDLFVFLGPSSDAVFENYAQLTGTTALPQMFAIGHHQCRWNYLNEEDVKEVSRKFDEYDIPMDVIWLDIEYAKEHEYFMWDKSNFGNPEEMQDALAAVGRQLVVIVDPHIKRDANYYVYKEAQDLGILSKQADGKSEYEGWCWPGSSSWTDFFNPVSWEWWIGLFKFNKFIGSKRNLWIWNDMNEPSVFNAPEITMPRDNIHYGGWEHRDVHNINGMVYHNVTAQALIKREDPPRRPFVLSRAFFAGSQRYGPIWTGDNMGTWEHLAGAGPMILGNSIAGMTFNGADVGGFFGNPEPEMLVRWYQNGAFHPFFRAHAHIDTKRREPYLFDEPIRSHLIDMIRLRYSLLPAWYTAFFRASLDGKPIIRPHYVAFPDDTAGFAVDNQYFIGESGLLTHPVVEQGALEATVYLADDEPYYDYFSHAIYTRSSSSSSRSHITVPAPLDKLPLFHHGGSILTRRDLVRRAAPLMWRDPISLVIALDKTGTRARGEIYLDDGDSYHHETGEFVWREFEVFGEPSKTLTLTSQDLVSRYAGGNEVFKKTIANYNPKNAFAEKISPVNIDDIVVLGLSSRPTCIRQTGTGAGIAFDWQDGLASNAGSRKNGASASILRIRSAGLPVTEDWQVEILFGKDVICEPHRSVTMPAKLADPTCPKAGQARCENAGHISACILLSRVNDGICDPECCDGSDETDGKVHCPNRCAEVNKAYRAEKDEEARIRRVGSKIRKDWSKAGLKDRKAIEKNIEKLKTELIGLQERETQLRDVLDKVEKSEASDIERKKASRVYQRIGEHQTAIQSLRKHRAFLQNQIGELSTLLSDLKKSFNPNYQDMAVLGSVRAFDEWRRKNGYEITDGPAVGTDAGSAASEVDGDADLALAKTEVQPVEVDFDDLSDEHLTNFEQEDILALLSEFETNKQAQAANLLFRLEEYLPDALRPHYDQARKSLLDTLANFGIISRTVIEQSERPDVSKARSTHQTAENALRDGQNRLKKEEEALTRDWGKDWAWKKLDGQCISKDTGDYTYELCWFGKASQKSNKGHGNTNLGKFAQWDPDAPAGSPEYYRTQIYSDGQRCWNGPDRSVIVDLECGTSNVLLSVVEPEKCTYLFKVQTPAVCDEVQVEEPIGKSEL